jgi:hypothetical protein
MPSGSWGRALLLGATNAGRAGLPLDMRQRIAPLVSPHVTKTGPEPNGMKFAFEPLLYQLLT